MKHTLGEIAFTTDGVLMSDDGKPLVCHENSPNRPREESRANRAHLCLCWNTHDELLETLHTIADFAVGNGDVCEIIARRARAAIAKGEGRS